MKAARINSYGDASVIKIEDINKPTASDGQVLIKVHASSVNPFDGMIRSGRMKDSVKLDLPVTIGGDLAGEVAAIGQGTIGFEIGDKVYGQASVVAGNSGAMAEFAATSAEQVAKMPTNLDFKQAASLPLVGVSALQVLTEHINLQPGQKVFIHGGAGGIGSIAIQIAKHIGAYVATTATGDGVDFVKKLGADEVIDYKSQDYASIIEDYDAAFDTVGDDFMKVLSVLKSGGVGVSMTAKADEARAKELGVKAITQSTKVNTERLAKLAKLVEDGAVATQVYKSFTLEQASEAFKEYESGKVKGKVVVAVEV